MRKIKAFVAIVRPTNVIMTFFVYLVSTAICSDQFYFTQNIFLAGISAIMVVASGNIINDYFDIEIDRINRPKRPLPSQLLSKKEAIFIYIILSSSSLVLSFKLSLIIFSIVLLTTILLLLYSSYFKKVLFLGNIIVAFCTGLVFIYGGVVVGKLENAIIPALFAFIINLIREILKDIEDVEGDALSNVITIPIKYGNSVSKKIILMLSLILIVFTFLPFILQMYKIEYLVIVLFFVNFPIIYLLRELYLNNFSSRISQLSMLLKVIMAFGLFAIYLGIN